VLKTLTELDLATETLKSADSRINYATHIAHSLRNFIDSFDWRTPDGTLIVPSNFVEMWFNKFQMKFASDS
jgi:hypothetical protein